MRARVPVPLLPCSLTIELDRLHIAENVHVPANHYGRWMPKRGTESRERQIVEGFDCSGGRLPPPAERGLGRRGAGGLSWAGKYAEALNYGILHHFAMPI